MSVIKEFKEFAVRGSVVDLAVGIIIGAAFTGVVNSVVKDIIMPPVGVLLGSVDFKNLFVLLKPGSTPPPYNSVDAAEKAGAVTLNYGLFLNTVVSFVIVAFVVFLLVRAINKLKRGEDLPPTTRECPFCVSAISMAAKRCPNCTSELPAA